MFDIFWTGKLNGNGVPLAPFPSVFSNCAGTTRCIVIIWSPNLELGCAGWPFVVAAAVSLTVSESVGFQELGVARLREKYVIAMAEHAMTPSTIEHVTNSERARLPALWRLTLLGKPA